MDFISSTLKRWLFCLNIESGVVMIFILVILFYPVPRKFLAVGGNYGVPVFAT